MSMTNTEKCRVKAEWRQCGNRLVYRLPCTPDTIIVEHLGGVKERGDGRWDWWRWKSDFHHQWMVGQGVALSQGAAEMCVLEGWAVYNGLDRIKEFMEERELTPGQAESLKAQTCGFQLNMKGDMPERSSSINISHVNRPITRNDV
jgi:hypothetical protein